MSAGSSRRRSRRVRNPADASGYDMTPQNFQPLFNPQGQVLEAQGGFRRRAHQNAIGDAGQYALIPNIAVGQGQAVNFHGQGQAGQAPNPQPQAQENAYQPDMIDRAIRWVDANGLDWLINADNILYTTVALQFGLGMYQRYKDQKEFQREFEDALNEAKLEHEKDLMRQYGYMGDGDDEVERGEKEIQRKGAGIGNWVSHHKGLATGLGVATGAVLLAPFTGGLSLVDGLGVLGAEAGGEYTMEAVLARELARHEAEVAEVAQGTDLTKAFYADYTKPFAPPEPEKMVWDIGRKKTE